MVTYLGIDQSLTCTGVCIMRQSGETIEVLHHEAITTKPTGLESYADTLNRANFIADRLLEIYIKYEVNHVMIEGLSFGSVGNATRNLAMLMATICNKLGLKEPETVPPTTLKKYATGSGKANKKDMLASIELDNIKTFNELNPLTIKAGKYDIADAYWLASYKINKK